MKAGAPAGNLCECQHVEIIGGQPDGITCQHWRLNEERQRRQAVRGGITRVVRVIITGNSRHLLTWTTNCSYDISIRQIWSALLMNTGYESPAAASIRHLERLYEHPKISATNDQIPNTEQRIGMSRVRSPNPSMWSVRNFPTRKVLDQKKKLSQNPTLGFELHHGNSLFVVRYLDESQRKVEAIQ